MRTISMTLAVAATLALAGCGGDGGPGPTAGTGSTSKDAPITSGGPATSSGTASSTSGSGSTSSTATSSASSTSTPATTSTTSTDTGKPFDAKEFTDRLEAAVDKNPTVKIDVQFGPDATASGTQDLANNTLEMDVDAGGQQMTYRLVDGQYYLAQPPKWFAVDDASTNPLVKKALEQTALLSMQTQLDAFVAGVESAGVKGTEKVDGVSTTHYTATVDTDKALRELGMAKAPGSPETAIYDVWLDDDDLIRKMSFTQNGANAVLTATDWGKPVSITKPTGSELAKVN
ncbi:LppX_LprAFG lipoprotein [Janibacter limosus]|uniref:LppX_LprAFG lipoprotein n=1 Tax=Janibacter limosus TaxID=53458 RepID=UPI00082BA0F6|nr:LppX_LprAFG lipoprotein [Janibacter limosus]